MTRLSNDRNHDPSLVATIAREVVRRLRESDGQPTVTPGERLITIETLDRYVGATEIFAAADAVITPAAREEAKRRGIRLRSADESSGEAHRVGNVATTEQDALAAQLAKRGIVLPTDVEIVWTQTPAAEVLNRCSKGQRATMVAALSDVQRFFDEIEPTVWVLDRQRLNLTAAMNVASRIALCSRTRGPHPNPSGGSE